jgi:hypothetical protein
MTLTVRNESGGFNSAVSGYTNQTHPKLLANRPSFREVPQVFLVFELETMVYFKAMS